MLGLLLAGIVAMQVEVLKMSASIGRSLTYSSALESRNQQLRVSVASLADDQRIERLAATMGMVMPRPDMIGFLSALPPSGLRAAIRNINTPDEGTFLYSTPPSDTGEVVTESSLAAELASDSVGGVSSSSVSGPGPASTVPDTGTSGTQGTPPAVSQPAQNPGSASTGTGSTGGGTGTGSAGAGTSTTGGATSPSAPSGGTSSGGGVSLTGSPSGGTQTTPTGG